MRQRAFEKLASKIRKGIGSKKDRAAFVDHAIVLRLGAIDRIDETHTWDQDWPELGYAKYSEDEGEVYDELRAFEHKHRK